MVDASSNELLAVPFVELEIVVLENVVPVPWCVIHEVNTEGRALACNGGNDATLLEDRLEPLLQTIAKAVELVVMALLIQS